MASKKYPDVWDSIVAEYAQNNGKTEFSVSVPEENPISDLMTPKEIVAELDKFVVGQRKAKQLLAAAVWNRQLALHNMVNGKTGDKYYFDKNNILLVGNTGCGKTHLVSSLADVVSMPVTIENATTFTSAGYVGRDVSTCVENLVENANSLLSKLLEQTNTYVPSGKHAEFVKRSTEYGIIYIDEADKIKASFQERGKDVNGVSVQEGFLKLIEGTDVDVKTKGYTGRINTANMLFIFGGAFSNLEKITGMRLNKREMGFGHGELREHTKTDILKKANIEDFVMFGIIPELMGRLSTLCILDEMSKEMIYDIFTKPRHSILSQITNEFASYGCTVSFTKDAIDLIVDRAFKLKLGARGLRSICQDVLRPLLFYMPTIKTSSPVIVSKELIEKLERIDM